MLVGIETFFKSNFCFNLFLKIISEDEPACQYNDKFEPCSKVHEKISLVGAECLTGKPNANFFGIGTKVRNTLTILTVFQNVELTFDYKKDSQVIEIVLLYI